MEQKKRASKHYDTVLSYRRLFKTKDGEVVLHDLMKAGKMLSTSHCENPYDTAYNEGARQMVLRILKMMKVDPKKLLEQIEKSEREEQEYEY